MDLMTAKQEAAARTSKAKGKLYLIVEEDGEVTLNRAPLRGVSHCFENGVEIPLPDSFEKQEKPAKKKSKKSGVNQQAANQDTVETAEPEAETEGKKKKSKKMKTKVKKETKKTAKKKDSSRAPKNGEQRIPRGNNMFLTEAEWKKVDAILAKEGTSFSAWSRGLVQAKIK